MSVSVGILDYILTGILPLPRWDARLVAWDHALGFDWRDWYAWVVRHPALHAIFHTVYGLLGPEMLALFITLELAGTCRHRQSLPATIHSYRHDHRFYRHVDASRRRLCVLPLACRRTYRLRPGDDRSTQRYVAQHQPV